MGRSFSWDTGSGGGYAGDVVPGGESVGHFGAAIARGELVSAGPKVRRNRAEHRYQHPRRAALFAHHVWIVSCETTMPRASINSATSRKLKANL